MPPPEPDPLQRWLQHRRPWEVAAWIIFWLGGAVANTVTVSLDVARLKLPFSTWEVAIWEFSSHLVWLALVPLVLHLAERWPLTWEQWRGSLLRHLPASLAVSVLHVLAMVALRKAVYAAAGGHYDFGHWPTELFYEALKDTRSYAGIVAIAGGWQLLMWRLQGEARLLQAPDDGEPAPAHATTPAPAPEDTVERPQRFLVKKLGKEFLLPTDEIEWVQACGNYVNLHRRQHDYPLRATLTGLEKRLDPAQFVRVHRSWLVNLAMVDAIEPTEAGDARVRMKDGGAVPCSRTFLDGLRQRLR
jgi:hypothetical protein